MNQTSLQIENKLDLILELLNELPEGKTINDQTILDGLSSKFKTNNWEITHEFLDKLVKDGHIVCLRLATLQYSITMDGKLFIQNKGYSEIKKRQDEMYSNSKTSAKWSKWSAFLVIISILIMIIIEIINHILKRV